jgi:hypothetical protein
MPNKTHRAPPRYKIPDFFSSLLEVRMKAVKLKYDSAEQMLQAVNDWIEEHPAPEWLNRDGEQLVSISYLENVRPTVANFRQAEADKLDLWRLASEGPTSQSTK